MSYEDLEDLLGEETFDYVEDTYIEADDLAEHAVPSPPPMDNDDDFDVDLWQYDYWMDIDYGSDGDEIRQRQLESRAARTKKRKLAEEAQASSIKRRKVPSRAKRPTGRVRPMDELWPVIKMKNAVVQRYEPQETRLVDVRTLKSEALLKDWRETFRHTPMWAKKKPAVELEEVEDAPDDDGLSQDEELGDARTLLEAAQTSGDVDGEWEDEDEDEEGEGEGEAMDLDPEALQMAIRQNLAAAGVNIKGMDEETLMRFAMKMFAGGGEADDVVGEFAEQILGGQKGDAADGADEEADQTEDEENGFAGWVQKQAEEKASKNEQDTHDLPTPADSEGRPSASPPDKRPIKDAVMAESSNGAQAQRGTKRKADSAIELNEPKRSARRFDAPTAASKARSVSGTAPPASTRKGRKN